MLVLPQLAPAKAALIDFRAWPKLTSHAAYVIETRSGLYSHGK